MSEQRRHREPIAGRRAADDHAWQLLCDTIRELREDVGDLAADVAELVSWKSRSEERERDQHRRTVTRRSAVTFYVGLATGLGGLALALLAAAGVHL